MTISFAINQLHSQPDNRISNTGAISQQANKLPRNNHISTQSPFKLSEAEKEQLRKLKARDREVRTHEQRHRSVAGQYARGISYSYQVGPDKQRYAVGGQVNLDTSPIPNDPEETIEKMEQIKRAALAPAEPSSKDRQVAAESDREIARQQAKIQREKSEEALNVYQSTEEKESPIINIYS